MFKQLVMVDSTRNVYGRVDTIEEWTPFGVRLTDHDHDYDFEGRLSKVSRPEGGVAYGYEELTGRLVEMATSLSRTTYTYDEIGPDEDGGGAHAERCGAGSADRDGISV